jgi:hypothetical protein
LGTSNGWDSGHPDTVGNARWETWSSESTMLLEQDPNWMLAKT